MMQFVGVDIVEIARIEGAASRWGERFLRRIYTAPEISAYGKNFASLAARFACKEAVMKLLGARGLSWLEIETLSRPEGRPYITLYGNAKIEAERLGLKDIAVSLTHSKEYAIAYASAASDKPSPG